MCFASLTLRIWRMFSVAMVSRVMILLASCVLSAMGDANDVLAACLYCQGGVPFSIYQPSALRVYVYSDVVVVVVNAITCSLI